MMMSALLRKLSLMGGLFSPLVLAEEAAKAPTSTVLADNNMTANLLQTSLGLLVVLAVIAAAAWGVKRFGHLRMGVQGQMKIVGGVSLGTRERVVLLQVGEQQLLLGVAPGQIRTLHVLNEPLSESDARITATAADVSSEPGFSERLKSAIIARGGK